MIQQIKRLFIGILLGIGIELLFAGLSLLVEKFITNNFDPASFVLWYPLLVILIIGIYFIIWQKQYVKTVGLFFGYLLFIFGMTILLFGT
ncbi:MAG: hypothetical protein HY005_02210 [Candidatus Staskawiczbacteria bacterium]|nr:hypothetical protein [Candidatus Staskawiczbacteria bacterium]